ncbi:IPT/TIG domain-containing protein [Candidatus Poribacteria bacterium]|nr:IPT/TIG domain-containing protein [Candidatus Poribacteria bacterium]
MPTPESSSPGTVAVGVTNPDGQSSANAIFTYNPLPQINSILPVSGPFSGGTHITITGTGFIERIEGENRQLTAEIDGVAGTDLRFVSDLELQVTTPHAPVQSDFGSVSVTLTNPDGQQAEGVFTYNPPPTVTDISPPNGNPDGGTEITITGAGFIEKIEGENRQLTVEIDGVAGTDLRFVSDRELQVTTPKHFEPGNVQVVVTNPDGLQADGTFTYNQKLVASNITPKIGPVSGGTEVVITGSSFILPINVTFGDNPGRIIAVRSDKIIVQAPENNGEESVDVTVTGPDGQEAKLENGFHYIDFPAGVLVYNYPNPTPVGEGTTFRFKASGEKVEIKIFNMAGELVRSRSSSGGNTILWDGRD